MSTTKEPSNQFDAKEIVKIISSNSIKLFITLLSRVSSNGTKEYQIILNY